ncbi:MAG: threonine synthase [Gemmatimonadaceae bacterium]|nr:threonine synthase [Chitinophagaceae bacterium]
MRYYSLNHQSPKVDFKEATINGQAPDKGLYFPETIPRIPKHVIDRLSEMSREDIAFEIIKPYVGDTIPAERLREIVRETIDFPIPLNPINDQISSLELFHGPTLAFKDIGARFMSRCLGHFMKGENRKVTVLVATSGDTGGAVASGFYEVEGVEVVILFPKGKVSRIQELQLTTFGKNIRAIEVAGSFDDCQKLVKEAFADEQLKESIFLTSANSINVARWLPQQFYYFFALQQWKHKTPPVISVPSGNFGNICAGILAHLSGLPVTHFIAACNANDVVPVYLETGLYTGKKSVATISNAMDVADPSNFIRIMELFHQELKMLKDVVSSESISDEQTRKTIKGVKNKWNYLLDPHGAVGYTALEKYLSKFHDLKGILLETAHPVKFHDTMEEILGEPVSIPATVESLSHKTAVKDSIEPNYQSLVAVLTNVWRNTCIN